MTSFLATLSFVAMTVSGVVLYFTPRGRTATWTDWRVWGWSKQQWADVHTTTSTLFVLAAVMHVWLNWRVLWSYLKGKAASGLALHWRMQVSSAVATDVGVSVIGMLLSLHPEQFPLFPPQQRHVPAQAPQRQAIGFLPPPGWLR
jgi:hypothetical protein